MERVRVSVVIPVKDREDCIARAVSSALAQDVEELEVVVVDDGSADDSAGAAAALGPKVRVFRQENQGPAAARNLGVAEARGEFIAFLDSDDEWLPGKLVAQLALLEREPGAALVGGWADFVDGRGNLIKRYQPREPGNLARALLYENFFPTPVVMVRRSALAELEGPFREDLPFAEDWELWIRLAARHGARIPPRPMAVCHRSPGSAQGAFPVGKQGEVLEMILAGLARDPAVSGLLNQEGGRPRANVRLMEAYEHYARGNRLAAVSKALAGWRAWGRPGAAKLVLPILFMPRVLRDGLRRNRA